MPIRHWVEGDRRRIRAVVWGNVTTEEALQAIEDSIRDPGFRPGFDVLSDHTEIGEPLSPSQARAMSARLESLAAQVGGSRWAIVTRKPASYGMMRMFAVLVERVPLTVQVFSSFEEAERWLASSRPGED